MYSNKEKQPGVQQLDDSAAEAFIAQFHQFGQTPKGTVRLFDRTDFFGAYGTDAEYIADQVYNTRTVIKHLGKAPKVLASVTLNPLTAIAFLRNALTTLQLRVEIYESDKGKWSLGKRASPGNLVQVEEMLFSNYDLNSAPVILALDIKEKLGRKTVGIAFADTSRMALGVAEFEDNDLFSNTESLLIQLGVKEVLLPTDEKKADYDLSKLRTVIERCSIVVTDRKKSTFSTKDVEQDLNRLLKSELLFNTLPESDLTIALASTAALVHYLSLMTDTSNHAQYSISTHDLSQYMKLDASALRALNLMPDPTGMGGSSKTMSLYGLLNRCKTSQGMRLLNRWLKQPLVNLHEIEKRQDLVECFMVNSLVRKTVSDDYLKAMPDLHRISKRFQKGVANLEDVVRVYQAILKLPGLISTLESGISAEENGHWEMLVREQFLDALTESHLAISPLVEMVETTIDLEQLANHQFVIKSDFDSELVTLHEQLQDCIQNLDKVHAEVASDLDMETDGKVLHFEANAIHGRVFRLTRKEAKEIKGKKAYIELSNKSNGVQFTTTRLKAIVTDQKECQLAYEKKQKDLVKEVILIAASYTVKLEELNDVLANIDVIVSFATSALLAPTPYVKPKVSPKGVGKVSLVDSRHPCLEVQDEVDFIPNDVDFERDVNEFHVITGANMGGKSTFIRQIGVIALMAQIGSFVPCASASLPIFDSILCRVGAGDSQLKGVSTFMAEMLETAAILKSATKDSLIVIDELGRGTSTYDGFGLAWAISEHIATEIRAFCLFATHFHELTTLATKIEHVNNFHVMALVEPKPDSITGKEITFLYRIQPGVCDQSFGIHVAELANFPPEVIKLAKRKADDLEDFTENPTEFNLSSTITPELTAAGTQLTEQILVAWSSLSTTAIEVDAMDTSEGGAIDVDAEIEKELNALKECVGGFEGELEASEWAQVVLAQTY